MRNEPMTIAINIQRELKRHNFCTKCYISLISIPLTIKQGYRKTVISLDYYLKIEKKSPEMIKNYNPDI